MTLTLSQGFALAALLASCATPTQSSRTTPLPDPGPDQEYQVHFPDPGHGVARYIGLTLGEELAKDCGLSQTHFQLDSAEPLTQDRLALETLARCLNRPQLVAHRLSLVGRTDDRGSSAHNEALGLRRAERVKELLVKAGVAADRIRTSTRGERDAVGDGTSYSHGYDRRVDAVLLGVIHAPRR